MASARSNASFVPSSSSAVARATTIASREALTCLPPRCQQLITPLLHDPPLPYAQIGATLGIPVGSIAHAAWTSYAATRPSPP